MRGSSGSWTRRPHLSSPRSSARCGRSELSDRYLANDDPADISSNQRIVDDPPTDVDYLLAHFEHHDPTGGADSPR